MDYRLIRRTNKTNQLQETYSGRVNAISENPGLCVSVENRNNILHTPCNAGFVCMEMDVNDHLLKL